MKLVLLPGMDGTGDLFARFIPHLPQVLEPVVIRYPNEAWGYEQLLPFVLDRLPVNEPFVLLGESFSGPLAISIAAQNLPNLQALILVCTFARNPQPLAIKFAVNMKYLPPIFIQRIAVRYGLANGLKSQYLENEVIAAVQTLSAATIWARLNAISSVDVLAQLKQIGCPTLYLSALRDRLIPRSCLRDLIKYSRDLKVVDVDGSHCLLQSNPIQCAAEVTSFFASVIDPSPEDAL